MGQEEIVQQLLDAGADYMTLDIMHKTPHYYATRYGHDKVAKLLEVGTSRNTDNP